MNKVLVVVDAWEKPFCAADAQNHPHFLQDTKAFGTFLNRVCEQERSRGTLIVHSASGRDVMKEIEICGEDTVVGSPSALTSVLSNFDKVYFCGFHFGRCIQTHVRQAALGSKASIVLNLSLTFPSDLWVNQLRKHAHFNYSLWNTVGFEDININSMVKGKL